MRTTINLDDSLLSRATQLSGRDNKTAVVNDGLRALVRELSARRLAALGGSEPDIQAPPRRRPEASG
ncbi:MAG: type II toxin-antitoxin system VapB family antitoxin [Bifidobacteriaceae bacterium]|jgi:Arc/MetJ family transcription regulator|nr:type II toxin-antitoxin system VapB family antitoxin [Bifidobacteriaceae bacterium]